MTMTFDTHEAVNRLKGASFSETQAEAITTLLHDVRAKDMSDLATKTDLAAIKSDLEILKRDLTIRLGSMIVVGVGFLTAIKFFG